ncbi:MAG: DUF167 domain-containing protein [Desulfurobacteriaceae bacterium]
MKLQPKASRNRVEKVEAGRLKVKVTVPPEGGKANKALIELLSKELKVPKSSISIVSGQTSRVKRVLIEGIDFAYLQKKLGVEVEEIS